MIYSNNEDVQAAVKAFWRGLESTLRKAGHRFKRGGAGSHVLNGGSVAIDLTDIVKAHTSYRYKPRQWSGKLLIRVSDGRYRGQPARMWRTPAAGWNFDEIAAHAVECAARNQRAAKAAEARQSARDATNADPRLKRLAARVRKLGGQLDVEEDGRVTFTTPPMSLDAASKVLSQTRGNTLDVLLGEGEEEE